LRTYFGRGIRQTVQGGTLARRRLADEGDERIARHITLQSREKVLVTINSKVWMFLQKKRHNVVSGHEGCAWCGCHGQVRLLV